MSLLTNLVSYWRLDGNSNDAVGSNNGVNLQAYTGYTKVGGASTLSATSSKITFTSLGQNETSYYYKDFGAGYFSGYFQHKFDFTSTGGNGGIIVWGMSNNLGDMNTLKIANYPYFMIFSGFSGATPTIELYEAYNGNLYTPSLYVGSLNTVYYLTVRFNPSVGTYGTIYCDIYSDSGRTTLITTLTLAITNPSLPAFRYLYGVNTYNIGAGYTHTGYIENLDTEDTAVIYSTSNGKINQGAGFNGTTSKIIGSTISTLPTNISISCWFKTTGTAHLIYPLIFGFNSTGVAFDFYQTADTGQFVLLLRGSVGGSQQAYVVSTSSSLNDGNWHFLVGVATNVTTGTSNSINFYVDGVSQGTAGGVNFTGNFNNPVTQFGYSIDGYFTGSIDECVYWNRALTLSDVEDLYNGGSGQSYPLLAHYSLKSDSISFLENEKGNLTSKNLDTISFIENISVARAIKLFVSDTISFIEKTSLFQTFLLVVKDTISFVEKINVLGAIHTYWTKITVDSTSWSPFTVVKTAWTKIMGSK